jgi:hypothetical protein
MHKYNVGWSRKDGSFNNIMSVGADNRNDAREEADRQLNRMGRRGHYVEWVKRGSQVRRVTMEQSSVINNRYQVLCTYCGQLSTERNKRDAMSAAVSYLGRDGHISEVCEVRVADLMANVGSVEVWQVTKEGIRVIGRKTA